MMMEEEEEDKGAPPNYEDLEGAGASLLPQQEQQGGRLQQFDHIQDSTPLSSRRLYSLLRSTQQQWRYFNQAFEYQMSKLGNPRLMKRLFYAFLGILVLFLLVISGVLPSLAQRSGSLFAGPVVQIDTLALRRFLLQLPMSAEGLLRDTRQMAAATRRVGSQEDIDYASGLANILRSMGMDLVEIDQYEAHATVPVKQRVRAVDSGWEANVEEDGVTAYFAYAAPGSVQGRVVHVEGDEFAPSAGKIALFPHSPMDDGLGWRMKKAQDVGVLGCLVYAQTNNDTAIYRGYASIPDLYLGDPTATNSTPTIPSIPITASDAAFILASGSEFLLSSEVESPSTHTWNVMGKINGIDQAEKIVVVGAHRDAFCYGAVSAASGTTTLLQVARAFAILRAEYFWRPRRSIVFASWGMKGVGSARFVQDHISALKEEGVAYLNLDGAIYGDRLSAAGSPAIHRLLSQVLATMEHENLTLPYVDDTMPIIQSASDSAAFQVSAGVSSIDLALTSTSYPRYSCGDNYDWMEREGDPTAESHIRLARLVAMLTLELADEPIIPFDFSVYAQDLLRFITQLARAHQDSALNFTQLQESAGTLMDNARVFHEWRQIWEEMGTETPVIALHRYSHNNRIVNFEKHLLLAGGIEQTRQQFAHAVLTPAMQSGLPFGGIVDAIQAGDWDLAQAQVDVAVAALDFASNKILH